jgi:hypothetical protein
MRLYEFLKQVFTGNVKSADRCQIYGNQFPFLHSIYMYIVSNKLCTPSTELPLGRACRSHALILTSTVKRLYDESLPIGTSYQKQY